MVQGDHSGCAKPSIDIKTKVYFSTWASYKNGTFVLMSAGGLNQCDVSPSKISQVDLASSYTVVYTEARFYDPWI